MSKKTVARWFVDWTDSWNKALHDAIEAKVMAEYKNTFPSGSRDVERTIADMRSFYYSRMTNTATLLVGMVAAIVALVALLVSVWTLVRT